MAICACFFVLQQKCEGKCAVFINSQRKSLASLVHFGEQIVLFFKAGVIKLHDGVDAKCFFGINGFAFVTDAFLRAVELQGGIVGANGRCLCPLFARQFDMFAAHIAMAGAC